MATTTKRGLNKPERTSFVDVITAINNNMDNLDDAVPDSRKVNGKALSSDVTIDDTDLPIIAGKIASTQAMIAPPFVEATPNAAGSYVTNAGALYYLPDGHTANATWANTTKTEVKAGSELTKLKSAFNNVSQKFVGNLLDGVTLTNGYTVNPANGNLTSASASWNATDYVPVVAGQTYKTLNLSAKNFAFYDINKTYVDLRNDTNVYSNQSINPSVVLPDGIYYARFTIANSSIGIAFFATAALHPGKKTIGDANEELEHRAFYGMMAKAAQGYLDGIKVLNPGMYEHGSLSDSGEYGTYNFASRIISRFKERYPFSIKYTPINGAQIAMRKYAADGTSTVGSFQTTPLYSPVDTDFILSIWNSADEEDVAEICENVIVEAVSLPGYYFENGYIQDKISAIIDKSPLDGLQFAFLTDVHVRQNAGKSPDLIRYIKDNTNAVPFIAFGGDVNVSTVDEGVDVREDARLWQSWMNKMGKTHVYQAQGNHDYLGFHYVESERVAFNETLGVCRQLVIGNLEDVHIVGVPGKLWYYVDIPTAKTRIVFLNDYDTTRNDGVFYGYNGISTDQVQWVVDKALDTEGIRVIFVSHQTYDTEMEGENQQVFVGMQRLFTSLANKTTFSYGAIQKDFTNSTIEFVAHLCGHMHADASNVNDGVLTVQTNCDGIMSNSVGRTAGTITEQAFDIVTVDFTNEKLYMTRIGYGSDREFNLT